MNNEIHASNRGHPRDMVFEFDNHIRITGAVWAILRRLPASARDAYYALKRRHADRQYVPIVLTQLAAEAGHHRSTMRRALNRLREAGLARMRVDFKQERWFLTRVKNESVVQP